MSAQLSAQNKKIVIVLSEFNKPIIERLLVGAKNAFIYYKGIKPNLKIYRVPGAFEIPGTIQKLLKHSNPDAIIALGAVIKGETPHFHYISSESTRGVSEISKNADIPIINGILTTNNSQQALDRSEPDGKNKGWDAIETALQTIEVYNKIQTKL